MVYVYKNSKSTFKGWTIPSDCIQISDEDYKKLIKGELVWESGKLVANRGE